MESDTVLDNKSRNIHPQRGFQETQVPTSASFTMMLEYLRHQHYSYLSKSEELLITGGEEGATLSELNTLTNPI